MSAPETATPAAPPTDRFDLFVIGGGVNGCGIARDAAGRGLRVGLAEMGDLAGATSSASTKLFHGGLRYLEYFEFRLVRESLIEREQLLKAMPHISWPMRFVLPIHPEMRFENSTPTSRLLKLVMPWMKGRRPAWLIRLGLFLYDNLGGREILPGTKSLSLDGTREGAPLKDSLHRAFEYSDAWVQDARLTVLNARDAARWGAQILPRTKVTGARPDGDGWQVDLEDAETGETRQISIAKCGTKIEIKATQAKSVAFRSEPEHAIVIKILPDGSFEEIYNGPGSLVWQQFSEKKLPSNGQFQISLAKLKVMNKSVRFEERIRP